MSGRERFWSEENENRLRLYVDERKTVGEMLALFGMPMSKNALRRKLDRMGLRECVQKAPTHPPKPEAPKCDRPSLPEKQSPYHMHDGPVFGLVPDAVPVTELHDLAGPRANCRWPLGSKPTWYCGHRVVPGQPYCRAHCKIAFRCS